jgi:hypothetical protein
MAERQFTRGRRPFGSEKIPVRSVRVSDAIWEKAKRRASYEGVNMSHVIHAIIEGYAEGLVNLPRVQVTYRQSVTGPTEGDDGQAAAVADGS